MCSGDGFREISKRDPDLELVETANTSAITDSKIPLRRVQEWGLHSWSPHHSEYSGIVITAITLIW